MARRHAAADHLPALEPDLARRGDAAGDLIAWTEGRALDRHRQPVPAGRCATAGRSPSTRPTTPTSFPGVGLGVLAVRARRVTDAMFMAAARALGECRRRAGDPRANLLPPVTTLRAVAVTVARAVARQARAEGQCPPFADEALDDLIAHKMWEPVYRPYRRKTRC